MIPIPFKRMKQYTQLRRRLHPPAAVKHMTGNSPRNTGYHQDQADRHHTFEQRKSRPTMIPSQDIPHLTVDIRHSIHVLNTVQAINMNYP